MNQRWSLGIANGAIYRLKQMRRAEKHPYPWTDVEGSKDYFEKFERAMFDARRETLNQRHSGEERVEIPKFL